MAFQKYRHSNQTKSFFQHWNSFVLSVCVLFCIIYCHIGVFSEAAALDEHHDGNKEEHPTLFTEGRPVNQSWISFPEATLVSLGLLISVILFVLLCSGGCCLNIFGKRGRTSEVRMQGFDNPISELGSISISDVRALQTNVDSVVFEPLPSVIDLTPLPQAPIVHRVNIVNNNSSSPWEPANTKSITIPSNVKKDPTQTTTTNSSKTLVLSVESFTQPQVRLNENNNKSSTPFQVVSNAIHEQQPKIKIHDNNNASSSLRNSELQSNPHPPTPIPTPLMNKTLLQVTPKTTTTTTTSSTAATTLLSTNITPVASNQSSLDSSIPDVSFVIIPPTPIPIVSEKEQVLQEKTCSSNIIQSSSSSSSNNNNNNVNLNNTSLPTTTSNDDNSSDYTTISTTTNVSSTSSFKEKESYISFENKSETGESEKNESQQVNVNTIISASDISSYNSSNSSISNNNNNSSNNISNSSCTVNPSIVKKLDFQSQEHSDDDEDEAKKAKYNISNNVAVGSHLKLRQEIGRKEEKIISLTPATTPFNQHEATLYHALVQAPTKQQQKSKEHIKSYGLQNTFECTFQDNNEVSPTPPQLNQEKEKISFNSLNYINESSSNNNPSSTSSSEQNAIIGTSYKRMIDSSGKSTSEKKPFSITHVSATCTEKSNGTVESTLYNYETSNENKDEEKDPIMFNIEREKVKQIIKEERHYNPNLRKTSTPNNSPPHKNFGQRNFMKNEALQESTDTENPQDFFSRTTEDVFEDFSMEFSTRISPISKGSSSDNSNSSWEKGAKLNLSNHDNNNAEINQNSSNVVLGASDDLGLGFYQRVTTELDLENVPRKLNNQAIDDSSSSNAQHQPDHFNDGIENVHIPSLFSSKNSILRTLPTETTTETNYESNPMELCTSANSNNTDPFASNHEDSGRVAYNDTFDLLDNKFENKKSTSTHNYENDKTANSLNDDDDDEEKTVKPNQKNFLLKSNQNPIIKKVIPRKLFTEEGDSSLMDESGKLNNDSASEITNNKLDINIIKTAVPTTSSSSTTSSSGTSTEFSSATNNNSTVLNKANVDKNVVESSSNNNETDNKNDESLPVNFKFGLTTILGESTTIDSVDDKSMLSNINSMNASDKFVEDIEAEIEEYGSLVMTDLEDNEENQRQELVKETREEEPDYSSIQRVIAFEDSSSKSDTEKSNIEASSSSSMEIDTVPSDFEISSKSNNIFDTKDNEMKRQQVDDGNKIFEDDDSGREISYLPLNQSVELVKDKFENSRTLLVTDIESDEHDDDYDAETVSRDIREFVPSKWNQKLTPQRSAIKSPVQQKSQTTTSFESTSGSSTVGSRVEKSSLKKSVSFERKKTQLVYEYPPAPVVDSDEEEKLQRQQKIQPLSNNGQLNLFLDWELQPDELEMIGPQDDWEDEFLKNHTKTSRTTNHPVMDMYRISGFESAPSPPSQPDPPPLPISSSSSSTLGELRHTRQSLKLDLNIGEACLLDSESSDFKPFGGKQQQLDSGVGLSNVSSPFNNYCDNH